jgi:hypothetical protein
MMSFALFGCFLLFGGLADAQNTTDPVTGPIENKVAAEVPSAAVTVTDTNGLTEAELKKTDERGPLSMTQWQAAKVSKTGVENLPGKDPAVTRSIAPSAHTDKADPASGYEESRFDVFVGYSYLRTLDSGPPLSNENGVNTSVFYNVRNWIAIGGDFSGHFSSHTYTGGVPSDLKFDYRAYHYLFGPQFSLHLGDRVKVFAHPLFGGYYSRGNFTWVGNTLPPFHTSHSIFSMAFGGGLDIRVHEHIAIRAVQFDYLTEKLSSSIRQNDLRFSTGIVFKIGKR